MKLLGASVAAAVLAIGCSEPAQPTTSSAAPGSNATSLAGAAPMASATSFASAVTPSAAPTTAASASSAAAGASSAAADDVGGPCEDLVPSRGMLARETDVAKRAPGRGPLPGQVRGVDASTRAPWKTLRDQDFAFAFVQAALGNKGNEAFRANWEAAKRCGFPRGAYHFVTAQTDGVTQAKTFLAARGDDIGEIPSTIDVEKPPSCTDECCEKSCKDWESTIRGWVDTVKAADHRDPMIYAVEPFWNQCVCGSRAFAAHPLWMPAWPKFDFPDPVKYGGWKRWDFYQYDGNVRVGDGVIDINLFRGSKDELVEFLRVTAPRKPGKIFTPVPTKNDLRPYPTLSPSTGRPWPAGIHGRGPPLGHRIVGGS